MTWNRGYTRVDIGFKVQSLRSKLLKGDCIRKRHRGCKGGYYEGRMKPNRASPIQLLGTHPGMRASRKLHLHMQ